MDAGRGAFGAVASAEFVAVGRAVSEVVGLPASDAEVASEVDFAAGVAAGSVAVVAVDGAS